MAQLTGVVQQKSATGVKIDGAWYSTYKGTGLENVQEGDTVDFLWEPDKKTGTYKNIKATTIKILSKGTGAAAPSGTKPAYTSSYVKPSSLGVELGHAANLAMELMLKHNEIRGVVIGDDEFYKEWVQHTDKIYRIMKTLRANKETEAAAKMATVSHEPILAEEELTDIFSR